MLKTYQFKSQCKGDIHCSKTANIIFSGLPTEYRWTPLRVQNRMHPRMLVQTTHVTEFEYYFTCIWTIQVINNTILVKRKVSYHKEIACQHSLSTVQKFSSRAVWSPCKVWLLFLILSTRSQNFWGTMRPGALWTKCGWTYRNTLLPHVLSYQISSL